MSTIERLESALVGAHKAGDLDATRKIAKVLRDAKKDPFSETPDYTVELPRREQEPQASVGESLIGAGEAALAMGTGAIGGAAGMIGGTLKGMASEMLKGEFGSRQAADRIEKQAVEGARAFTYEPRTEAGQQMVEAVGEATSELPPVLPLAAGQGAILAQSARSAAPLAAGAAATAGGAITRGAKAAVDRLPVGSKQPSMETPAVAAAGRGAEMQKAAEEMGFSPMTRGQTTRAHEDVQFEREMAKDPEFGKPLRERYLQHNIEAQQAFDRFIDKTDSKLEMPGEVGASVIKATKSALDKAQKRVSNLYQIAEKKGELEGPVKLEGFVDYLNKNKSSAVSATVLTAMRNKAIEVGAAIEDAQGKLVATPIKLKDGEDLRRAIFLSSPNKDMSMYHGGALRRAYDADTEEAGGISYKQARRERLRQARNFDNIRLVKQLTEDEQATGVRGLAVEDVLNKVVLSPATSLQHMKHIRKLLETEGPEGKQAWKEIRGATIRHIKTEALKNSSTDENGNRILSPGALEKTLAALDRSGKLDAMFGKEGAEQLRAIKDLSKTLFTYPPGSVNHSNTASVLLAMLDVLMLSSGIPVAVTPVKMAVKAIRDKRLKARVQRALENKPEK